MQIDLLVNIDEPRDVQALMTNVRYVLTTGEFEKVFTSLCVGMDMEQRYAVHRALCKDLKRNNLCIARSAIFQEVAAYESNN